MFIGRRRNNNVWGGGEVPPPPTPLDALEPFARFVASKGGGRRGHFPPTPVVVVAAVAYKHDALGVWRPSGARGSAGCDIRHI